MRRTRVLVAFLLLAVVQPTTRTFAQTDAPPVSEGPDRWRAALDFGFNGSTGNTRLMVLTTGFSLKHLQTDLIEFEWNSSLRYGESEGKVVARALRTSISADYRPQDRWSPFVFTQAERDPFRRLDLRTNVGAGVKHTFTRSEDAELSLSAAALHYREDFTDAVGTPIGTRIDARWSFRARGVRRLGNGVRLDNTTFYKPVWDDSGDYELDTNTSVRVRLSERIGLRFSHSFRRDSTPPSDVEPNDQIVQAGITIEI